MRYFQFEHDFTLGDRVQITADNLMYANRKAVVRNIDASGWCWLELADTPAEMKGKLVMVSPMQIIKL